MLRFTCLFALALLMGCGPAKRQDAPTFPVKGEVTLDGKAMPEGDVQFENRAAGINQTLPVKEGKFEGKAPAGTYRVSVYAYKTGEVPEMYKNQPEMAKPSKENYIPPRFNTGAENKQSAEVKTEGANEYKFEVQSK